MVLFFAILGKVSEVVAAESKVKIVHGSLACHFTCALHTTLPSVAFVVLLLCAGKMKRAKMQDVVGHKVLDWLGLGFFPGLFTCCSRRVSL